MYCVTYWKFTVPGPLQLSLCMTSVSFGGAEEARKRES